MKKLYLLSALVVALVVGYNVVHAPAQINQGFLLGGFLASAPGTSPSTCNNPTVPHPALVANFTTLAYCADFTQQTTMNNVVNHTSGTMAWTTMANWLDCAGSTSPQWGLNNNFPRTNGPCSDISVGLDPTVNLNALTITLTSSDGPGIVPGISTAVGGGTYFMTYPGTNSYYEVKYRVSTAQVSNITFNSAGYSGWFDFYSWYRGSCGMEIDFIETFIGSSDTAEGLIDWCNQNNHSIGPNKFVGTDDSNYHVTGGLSTSNGVSGQIGICIYIDGVAPNPVPSIGGSPQCQANTPSNSSEYSEMSFLTMINDAALNAATVTGNVTVWIEWIRVWSCAGWNNGTPAAGTNNCSVAAPFTGTPP